MDHIHLFLLNFCFKYNWIPSCTLLQGYKCSAEFGATDQTHLSRNEALFPTISKSGERWKKPGLTQEVIPGLEHTCSILKQNQSHAHPEDKHVNKKPEIPCYISSLNLINQLNHRKLWIRGLTDRMRVHCLSQHFQIFQIMDWGRKHLLGANHNLSNTKKIQSAPAHAADCIIGDESQKQETLIFS